MEGDKTQIFYVHGGMTFKNQDDYCFFLLPFPFTCTCPGIGPLFPFLYFKLRTCNKVLCTGTTILNHSLDEILSCCSSDAFVSIIGPTAGYFPDPVFALGVDVVGGRIVKNGELFLQRLAEKKCCKKKDALVHCLRWDGDHRSKFQDHVFALGR